MAERMLHQLVKAVATVVLMVVVAMEARAEHIGPFPTGASDCVKCEMDVTWLSKSSFFFQNIKLSDTCCDDRPVYFYAQAWERHNFPRHYGRLGCNRVHKFDAIPGKYSPSVRYLHIYCCVDEGFFGRRNCKSRVVYNPLY